MASERGARARIWAKEDDDKSAGIVRKAPHPRASRCCFQQRATEAQGSLQRFDGTLVAWKFGRDV